MLPIGQELWLKELETYIDFPPLQNPATTIWTRSSSRSEMKTAVPTSVKHR